MILSLSAELNKFDGLQKELINFSRHWSDAHRRDVVLVGGLVRDLMLNRQTKDFDLMVDAPAQVFVDAMSSEFGCKTIYHPTFLTYRVDFPDGQKVDVVTAREESYPIAGALPVVHPTEIPNDFKRRDFSINAMACSLSSDKFGVLLDPLNGKSDLDQKIIRVLHDKSFIDDPTRICRAARFSSRFSFELDVKTKQLLDVACQANLINHLTPVRRRHEFEIVLLENDPLKSLRKLEEWGALKQIHEEWRILPEHESLFLEKKQMSHNECLGRWFKPWGTVKAKYMMSSLQFERKTKATILAQF